jgi:hypothetical protein
MFFRHFPDEAGVGADGHDLGAVTHNARILDQPVAELIGLRRKPARLEFQKRLLKPGPFVSMTLQAKPAENTRRVVSASTRSSSSLAGAFGLGFGGSSRFNAFAPPLRFSARIRIVVNGTVMRRSYWVPLMRAR